MSEENRSTLENNEQNENREKNEKIEELTPAQADAVSRLAASGDLRRDKTIKKMGMGKILLIALIVCALGVGIFFLAQALTPEPEAPQEYISTARPVTLSARTKQDVSRVEIEHNGSTTVYIMGADGQAYVESDPDFPLNQVSVGSVFFAFASLTTEDTVADDSANKADFGFNPYLAKATATYTDGEVREYYLGNKSPAGNTWYFMAEGSDEIYLVWVNVGNYMTADYKTLRKNSALTIPNIESTVHLIVENSHGITELKPYLEGAKTSGFATWHLLQPYTVDADNETTSEFIVAVEGLAVKTYIGTADDLHKYGLAPEDKPARIYLEDFDGLTIDVLIGAKYSSTEYFAWSPEFPDDVFTISSTQAEAVLNAKPFSFTSIFAALVNIVEIEGLDLEIDGKQYKMTIERAIQKDENGNDKMLTETTYDYLYTYFINGKEIAEDAFRTMYQSIIGITVEGGLPMVENGVIDRDGLSDKNIIASIKYYYHDETGYDDLDVTYVPYKSLYYAVKTTETGDFYFFLTKEKLSKIVTAVELVLE